MSRASAGGRDRELGIDLLLCCWNQYANNNRNACSTFLLGGDGHLLLAIRSILERDS